MATTTRFTLNGKPVRVASARSRMLVWVLRQELGLTGTKVGCEAGLCGACTVLVDGEPVPACATPLRDVAGKSVLTIEGLAQDGDLHPPAAGLPGAPRLPVRLLHPRHDPGRLRPAPEQARGHPGRGPGRPGRQPVPVRGPRADPGRGGGGPGRARRRAMRRREFLKAAGLTGLFLFFRGRAQAAPLVAARPDEYPEDFKRLPADRRRWPGGLLRGQGGTGPGHHDRPGGGGGRGVGRGSGAGRPGHGRHTDLCPLDSGTGGSLSLWQFGPVLRGAAAEARAALLDLAAERLGARPGDLAVADGVVSVKGSPDRQVSYGDLVQGRRIERHLGRVRPKDLAACRLIGHAAPPQGRPGEGHGHGPLYRRLQPARDPARLRGPTARPWPGPQDAGRRRGGADPRRAGGAGRVPGRGPARAAGRGPPGPGQGQGRIRRHRAGAGWPERLSAPGGAQPGAPGGGPAGRPQGCRGAGDRRGGGGIPQRLCGPRHPGAPHQRGSVARAAG